MIEITNTSFVAYIQKNKVKHVIIFMKWFTFRHVDSLKSWTFISKGDSGKISQILKVERL